MALSLGKESSLTYLAKINSFRSISLNKLTLRGQTKVNAFISHCGTLLPCS